MIRVLLADDQRLVRAGFRSILDGEPDITVIGEAGDGAEALRMVRRERPDVVLMDVRMPVMDGLEATRLIGADPELAGVRIVILTTYEQDDYVFTALRGGASGFLLKDAEPDELIRCVRVVARGDALLAPSVTRRLIADVATRPGRQAPPLPAGSLTPREAEIADLVAGGLSNDEIAGRLTISPMTAKTHVSRVLGKLGLRDRAQLVVWVYEAGRVRPGWLDS